MKIEGNPGAQPLLERGRSSNPNGPVGGAMGAAMGDTHASAGSSSNSSASGAPGEDQAQFSGVHVHVQALAEQVLQFPEMRQEKVTALRQALLGGNYQPSSKQVADAVLAQMLVTTAA